jgi:hypothetical protein
MDKDYILEKLDGKYIVNERTNCWVWNGTTENNEKYYPQLSINCANYYVHRLMAYTHSNIININNLGSVEHSCKNKRCINPDHLKFDRDSIIDFSQEIESVIQMYMKRRNIFDRNKAIGGLMSIGAYNFLKEEEEI